MTGANATIQWLGTPRHLGQVLPTIIESVQDALEDEAEVRGSTRTFLTTGIVDAPTCQALRDWGGNAQTVGLRTLVNSWGAELQAACVEAGFGGPTPGGDFPWGAFAQTTLALQQQIQAALRRRGNCPLTEPLDGKLGPQTCAAGRYLEQQGVAINGWTQARANCRSYSTTWRASAPCAGTSAEPTPPAPPPAVATGGGIGAGSVALLAAAALAGYFLLTQV